MFIFLYSLLNFIIKGLSTFIILIIFMFLLFLLFLSIWSGEVLYIDNIIHPSQLLLSQYLDNSLIWTNIEHLLNWHYVPASAAYCLVQDATYIIVVVIKTLSILPILTATTTTIIIIVTTITTTHIRLEPEHILTQCFYKHEVIINFDISNILLRKVFTR